MSRWIPPGISRARVAVLIVVPVVVFALLAVGGMLATGMIALLSAMGHGSLTRQESIPYFIVFGVIALGGTALTTRVLERRLIAAKRDRTPQEYALVKRTRTLSAVLAAAVAIGGPPSVMEWGFKERLPTRDHVATTSARAPSINSGSVDRTAPIVRFAASRSIRRTLRSREQQRHTRLVTIQRRSSR